MPWNFQIQYSYVHSNVIVCIDVYCHIIDKDDVSGNHLHSKNISCYFNCGIDTVKITLLNRQLTREFFKYIKYSYLHSNVIMSIDVYFHIIDKMA